MQTKIQAIISDVDGVMVGKTEGVNFPLPDRETINDLKVVNQSGIPIILCTGKFHLSVKKIIIDAGLDNFHITDNGSLLVNPIRDIINLKAELEQQTIRTLIDKVISLGIYTEIFTARHYYVLNSDEPSFSTKRVKLLQFEPAEIKSIEPIIDNGGVIKLQAFPRNDQQMKDLKDSVEQEKILMSYIWSAHPYHPDRPIMIISPPDISKQSAVKDIIDKLEIPFDNVLGIGDSPSDWDFIQLCGFAATVGENSSKLQEFCALKAVNNLYFAGSVENQGLLAILRHFKLL